MMNFFNFGGQGEEARPGDTNDMEDHSIALSCLDSQDCNIERDNLDKGKQIEVNSQVSSVVRLDDDSNDAESITFQL